MKPACGCVHVACSSAASVARDAPSFAAPGEKLMRTCFAHKTDVMLRTSTSNRPRSAEHAARRNMAQDEANLHAVNLKVVQRGQRVGGTRLEFLRSG